MADTCEGLEDPFLGLILHRLCFRPARGHSHHIERLAVVTPGISPVVGDQIHFTEAWGVLVPLRIGADRDAVFQEGAGFGGRPGERDELLLFFVE